MKKQLGKNSLLERSSKDEIKGQCVQCECEQTIAYWDYELEHYIYLVDEDEEELLCGGCISIPQVELFNKELELVI